MKFMLGGQLIRNQQVTSSSLVVGSNSGGVWRSLVARFVRDEEVAGSNPVTPTKSSVRKVFTYEHSIFCVPKHE